MGKAFDVKLARLEGPDLFARYRVPDASESGRDADLADDTEIMLLERGDEARALLVHQMMYHHLAQGELAGEPFMVSF